MQVTVDMYLSRTRKPVKRLRTRPFGPQNLPERQRFESNTFVGYEFCVIDGISEKEKLEVLICQHRGEIVQNPRKSTHFVVGSTKNMKLGHLICNKQWNVIKPSWIQKCIQANQVTFAVTEEDYFCTTSETQAMIEEALFSFPNEVNTTPSG